MALSPTWKYLRKFSNVIVSSVFAVMGHTQRTRVSKMDYYNLFLTCTYVFLLCLNIPVDCYVLHRSRRQSGIAHHPIYWNESNQIFHADNNWHVKEVNLGDSITIKCPHKSLPGYQEAVNNQDLYYAIFMASESNYNTCAKNKDAQTKKLLRCDRPEEGKDPHQLIINFVDFTPVPGVPEFQAGKSYYVYTMSTGAEDGLDNANTAESACHRRNMKVTFVVRGAAPPSSSPASVPRTPSTSTTTTTPSPPRVDQTTTTSATKKTIKTVVPKTTKKIPSGGTDDNHNNVEGKGDTGQQTSGQSCVRLDNYLLLMLLCFALHLFLLLRT